MREVRVKGVQVAPPPLLPLLRGRGILFRVTVALKDRDDRLTVSIGGKVLACIDILPNLDLAIVVSMSSSKHGTQPIVPIRRSGKG